MTDEIKTDDLDELLDQAAAPPPDEEPVEDETAGESAGGEATEEAAGENSSGEDGGTSQAAGGEAEEGGGGDSILSADDLDNLKEGVLDDPDGPGAGVGSEPEVDPAEWGLSDDELAGAVAPEPAGERVEAAEFEDFAPQKKNTHSRDLEFILDIPLQLTVEVGRTHVEIGDLLQLGPGSIIELEKLAGEPLEIYANNKLVARGEAVIINEKFGIRLTDVVSKQDRIENLQ